jgi:uncharacterized protein YerC
LTNPKEEDEFICKAAKPLKNLETCWRAFEYVCDFDRIKLFRKRK